MITLFIVASLEGWPDIMHNLVDANGVDKGPIENNSPMNAYYFIIFIFIGSFFFLNFFVGMLFLNFKAAQKNESKGISEKHMHWLDMQRMILKASPDFETIYVPKAKWRERFFTLVISNKFDIFIMICIVLNMIQMAIVYEGASAEFINGLEISNYVFTSIFFLEATLKLIAFGKSYFKNSWNKFDFIVVVSSLLDIAMGMLEQSSLKFLRIGPQLARVMRVLRVSRILRLIGKYKGLQALIQTIMFSLPSLFNVFSLLMLVYFIFAVLGVFIFRNVREGQVINQYKNFENFGNSMILLIAVSTGEDWNKIMYDTANTSPDCVPGRNCGVGYGLVYFISFVVICTFVMLNLFILVILQQFDTYYLDTDNVIEKFKNNLEVFKETWKLFSARFVGIKIKDTELIDFFRALKEPIGMPNLEKDLIKREIIQMGIRSEEGMVFFNELLYRTMRRVYGNLKLSSDLRKFEFKTQF